MPKAREHPMKIREFSYREPYEETLNAHLMRLLSTQIPDVRITSPIEDAAQVWFRHLLYDVYVPRGFHASCRAWLSRLYGYAPRWERRIPQWLVCQCSRLACSDPIFLRPAFGTTHDFGASCMIMPGNQRFRLYRFHDRTVVTTPKHGFSSTGLETEIAFRQRPDVPDFVMPCRSQGMEIMEETWLDAIPINRLGNTRQKNEVMPRLHSILAKLRDMDAVTVTGEAYAKTLQEAFDARWKRLSERFSDLPKNVLAVPFAHAKDVIQKQAHLVLCRSHGDFQPGNILMDRSGKLTVIDWEDTAIRACGYDAMVFELRARSPRGLAGRVTRFIQDAAPLPPFLSSLHMTRQMLAALWFCEECLWQCEVSARDGICRIPEGFSLFAQETASFFPRR